MGKKKRDITNTERTDLICQVRGYKHGLVETRRSY
jgi:hypothetical protein